MFWKTALALSVFLAVTVLPCHADHDDNRTSDEYSGHDGQATLPDPNDLGTPSLNEIRSSLDQNSTSFDYNLPSSPVFYQFEQYNPDSHGQYVVIYSKAEFRYDHGWYTYQEFRNDLCMYGKTPEEVAQIMHILQP